MSRMYYNRGIYRDGLCVGSRSARVHGEEGSVVATIPGRIAGQRTHVRPALARGNRRGTKLDGKIIVRRNHLKESAAT